MAFMIYRLDFDLVRDSISLYIQRSSIPVVINELLDKNVSQRNGVDCGKKNFSG